jgi:hypothetical protein
VPQVLAELGRTWQPFGGAGYFVLLALLGIAMFLAGVLVLLPVLQAVLQAVLKAQRPQRQRRFSAPAGLYFALIGFAFLLVEIPLLQRFILFLGQPAYAMTAVLFSLLFFSGIGSLWTGGRTPASLQRMLSALALLALALRLTLPLLFEATLGLEFPYRLALAVAALAPLGFLMGIPFPAGIRWLLDRSEANPESEAEQVPWVWAVNGAASVVAAVLAALLALSFGFDLVFLLGALCYASAWGVFRWQGLRLPREATGVMVG